MSSIQWENCLVELEPDPATIAVGLDEHEAAVAGWFAEADRPATKVTGLAWTVHELAAHVAATAENYAKIAAGQRVVEQPLSARQQVIDDAIHERLRIGVPDLVATIETNTAALARRVRGSDPESSVPYYGVQTPLWVVAGMCLSELIIHGEDLRRTVRGAERVDEAGAYQAFMSGAALSSFVLSDWGRAQTMTMGYQATGMAPIIVAMDRGDVTVSHHSNRPVDGWLGGSARHLLLTAYGRTGLLGGLRTLRLKGRRPYLALAAARAFESI